MTNPYTPPSSPAPNTDRKIPKAFKKRHGCLTTWLVLMIAGNSIMAIAVFFLVENFAKTNPNFPTWTALPVSLLAILNVVFAVALYNWKKWGFIGLVVVAAIVVSLKIVGGAGFAETLPGLAGILILFLVLQIGGDWNGWDQLE